MVLRRMGDEATYPVAGIVFKAVKVLRTLILRRDCAAQMIEASACYVKREV